MTTVVNTPGGANGDSSGAGIIVGVLLAIVLIALFVLYGLPALRNNQAPNDGGTNINVTLPPAAPAPSPATY